MFVFKVFRRCVSVLLVPLLARLHFHVPTAPTWHSCLAGNWHTASKTRIFSPKWSHYLFIWIENVSWLVKLSITHPLFKCHPLQALWAVSSHHGDHRGSFCGSPLQQPASCKRGTALQLQVTLQSSGEEAAIYFKMLMSSGHNVTQV